MWSAKDFIIIFTATCCLKKGGTNTHIKTANGNTSPVSGQVSSKGKLGTNTYICNASVVPKLAYNAVVRKDFLYDNHAVIDINGQTVAFANKHIVDFASTDVKDTISDVLTSNTYVRKGHCEVIFPVCLAKPMDRVVGLIDANKTLLNKYTLIAASTLSLPDNDYHMNFRLINPTDEPVLIHKGTTIGTFLMQALLTIVKVIHPSLQ